MSNGAKLKKLRPNRRNRKKNPIHTITYMKKKKKNITEKNVIFLRTI